MLRNMFVGIALVLLLGGCQNQQYKVLCDTQISRSQCDVSALDSPRCRRANAAVDGCASYVSYQVQYLEDAKRKEAGFKESSYRQSAAEPLLLGVVGTGTKNFARVENSTLGSYSGSVYFAQRLMEERVNAYKWAVQRYLKDLSSGYVASDQEVKSAITGIEALRAPYAEAVAMGQPIVAFYASQPVQDFESMAEQVVAKTNPRDPYLRLGAERAKQQHRRFENNTPLVQAQSAVAQFKALQAVLAVPYAEQFALVKTQAVAEAAKAQRIAEKQRARSSSSQSEAHSNGSRSRDSGCSCAGWNVCYGPRGGRYCITSGGNKRYGI